MTQPTRLDIEHESRDGVDVLRLRGELDLTNAHELADALAATSKPVVVLDLGTLVFVDSAGIRTIDAGNRLLVDADRALRVVAPSESRAAWTFRVAGFAEGAVLESVDDALPSSSS
jgi:anti-anti-sigma factor